MHAPRMLCIPSPVPVITMCYRMLCACCPCVYHAMCVVAGGLSPPSVVGGLSLCLCLSLIPSWLVVCLCCVWSVPLPVRGCWWSVPVVWSGMSPCPVDGVCSPSSGSVSRVSASSPPTLSPRHLRHTHVTCVHKTHMPPSDSLTTVGCLVARVSWIPGCSLCLGICCPPLSCCFPLSAPPHSYTLCALLLLSNLCRLSPLLHC